MRRLGCGLQNQCISSAEIGRVEVVEPRQRLEAGPRRLEVVDADEDVDDRLGVEAGHRGAADVVDAARRPLARSPPSSAARSRVESVRPGGVVRDEADRFVQGQPCSLSPTGFGGSPAVRPAAISSMTLPDRRHP